MNAAIFLMPRLDERDLAIGAIERTEHAVMPSPGKPKILRTSREPAPTFSEFLSQSQSTEEGPKLKGAELGAHSTTRSDGGLRESRRPTIRRRAGRFLSSARHVGGIAGKIIVGEDVIQSEPARPRSDEFLHRRRSGGFGGNVGNRHANAPTPPL
jgi:hypothetical protein